MDRTILPFPTPAETTQPSVLLVESSADDREVLRVVLENRGLRIFEADEAETGLRLAEQHRPDVIVLDLEAQSADRDDLQAQYDAATSGSQSSLIVLGKARRFESLPRDQVVAKPFHFGPLVRMIEQLAGKAA